jgi:hypothetical protein
MRAIRTSRLSLALALVVATACGSSSRAPTTATPDAGGGGPSEPALPVAPTIASASCTLTTGKGIWSDGTHPDETTDAMNAAIASLVAGGCGHVRVPAGTYALGKQVASDFTVGLDLPSGTSLELDPAATLRLRPTATPEVRRALLRLRGRAGAAAVAGRRVGRDPGRAGGRAAAHLGADERVAARATGAVAHLGAARIAAAGGGGRARALRCALHGHAGVKLPASACIESRSLPGSPPVSSTSPFGSKVAVA